MNEAAEQATVENEENKSKACSKPLLQQHFGYLIAALALATLIVITVTLQFFQGKWQHELANQQILQLEEQQIYSVELSQLAQTIDNALLATNGEQLYSHHQRLLDVTQNLATIASAQQASFQSQLTEVRSLSKLAQRIQQHSQRNEKLKQAVLTQLQLLSESLNAIDTEIIESEQLAALNLSLQQSRLTIESLSLSSSKTSFDLLKATLANAIKLTGLSESQTIESNQEFINRLEDLNKLLYSEQSVLAKWQGYLRLARQYKEQLVVIQNKVKQISLQLDVISKVKSTTKLEQQLASYGIETGEQQITRLLTVLIFVLLFSLILVLYLYYQKVKSSLKKVVAHVKQCAQTDNVVELGYFCLEVEQLTGVVTTLKQHAHLQEELNSSLALLSEQAKDIARLSDENNTLQQQVVSENRNYQARLEALLSEHKAKIIRLRQTIAVTIVQMANECNQLVSTRPLRYIDATLSQWQYGISLRSAGHSLSLSDVNLVSLIQASIFNLSQEFSRYENTICLKISEQVNSSIKVDTLLFTHFLRVFSQLLMLDHQKAKLVLEVKLRDKRHGQQIIQLVGKAITKQKAMPQCLQDFQSGEADNTGLLATFNLLLQQLHSEEPLLSLLDTGYQLSVNVPIAIVADQTVASDAATLSKASENSFNNLLLAEKDFTGIIAKAQQSQLYHNGPHSVLLGVNVLTEHHKLLGYLAWLGIGVELEVNESRLQQRWLTGRYSLLLTEFNIDANLYYTVDDNQEECSLLRGIFMINDQSLLSAKHGKKWRVGNVKANANLTELAEVLAPWLIHQKQSLTDQVVSPLDTATVVAQAANAAPTKVNLPPVIEASNVALDFERYLQHQANVELALFMLDDYLHNIELNVVNLASALAKQQQDKAQIAVELIHKDAKILAASHLKQLAIHWLTLLASEEGLANKALIKKLLSKTKAETVNLKKYIAAL